MFGKDGVFVTDGWVEFSVEGQFFALFVYAKSGLKRNILAKMAKLLRKLTKGRGTHVRRTATFLMAVDACELEKHAAVVKRNIGQNQQNFLVYVSERHRLRASLLNIILWLVLCL